MLGACIMDGFVYHSNILWAIIMGQDDISTYWEAMGLDVIATCWEVIGMDFTAIVTCCDTIRMGLVVIIACREVNVKRLYVIVTCCMAIFTSCYVVTFHTCCTSTFLVWWRWRGWSLGVSQKICLEVSWTVRFMGGVGGGGGYWHNEIRDGCGSTKSYNLISDDLIVFIETDNMHVDTKSLKCKVSRMSEIV